MRGRRRECRCTFAQGRCLLCREAWWHRRFERLAALEKTANPEPGWSDAVDRSWQHGGFTGDKHESLILAQNERWRHA